MVASFPEFDYSRHRSNKGGCVPAAQKPSRLKSSLSSKSSADSTLFAKIFSFHGSFISSNRNTRKRTQIPGHSNSESKLKGPKGSNTSADDIQLHTAPLVCKNSSDPGACERNAAAKDGASASQMRRQWSSYQSSSFCSTASAGSQENDSQAGDLFQAGGVEPRPGKHSATEMGNFANKIGKACRPQSSVVSQLGDIVGQDGKFGSGKCDQIEVDDYAHRLKNRCSTQDSNSVDKLDANLGMEKLNSLDVGVKCVTQSSIQNGARVEVKNSNAAHQNKAGTEASSCHVVVELPDAAQNKENSHKVGSSALGTPNFSSENCALYASDNSSNNMRWSSTSCASTDTSSSNSTRRSSCESRVPSAAPPAFLAKPHKAHDAAWAAIRRLQLRQGGAPLAITHFNLIRRVGHGDIGSVFLAHLKDKLVASPLDASCLFAIKVMDKDALLQRNKLQRMHMEKEILECVDHPFLPTLYAHFDSEHFSCLVMDFCPGGDLYALRQKQPGKRFGLIAARFYAAEVLLALEYLHMLGIVYRDLKPENVLVREDGHIMLTDFDLSLKADVKPELVRHSLLSSSSLSNSTSKRRLLRSYSQSSTISSSSSTSFLHHESTNCSLPAACSIDPIISCLTLTNNASKRAPQLPKQPSPIGFSMLSSKVSKASHAHASYHNDGSISEPLKISKQDVLCSESAPSMSDEIDSGEAARGAKISSLHSRSNASCQAHLDDSTAQVSKESHDSTPSAGHSRGAHKSDSAERALTSGLGCQEEDNLMFMELVAEPTQARSMSFVGTHEYLAPEIIAGYGHGSPVDWWTFGIFMYELLYGRSPFKGASNDQTLINIIRQNLRFPEAVGAEIEGMEDAKSLIQGLLMKDPRRRMGCSKGAAEIKQHAFFKGVNWALIRCTQPPEVPSPGKKGMHASSNHHHHHRHHHHHHSKSLHQFADYF